MRKLGSVPLPALESAQLQIRALQRELAIATARVELESELREPLYERIAELEARLEIHHLDENGNAHIDEQHDGIYCRDETIRMQDERIAELGRGEYICNKCGIRKDAEFERGDF